MLTKLERLDDLKSLNVGNPLLMVRRGSQPIDNFFVHGKFHAVDGDWLDVSNSARLPLTHDSLLGVLSGQCSVHSEESVVSYRLTGFQDPSKNFPSPNYEIYT